MAVDVLYDGSNLEVSSIAEVYLNVRKQKAKEEEKKGDRRGEAEETETKITLSLFQI